MTTRQRVIEVAERECRKLRDGRKMYSPYGTHTLYADLKKSGITTLPQNFIEWRMWLRDMRLNSMWLRLHNEGCMIAGYTHLKRK